MKPLKYKPHPITRKTNLPSEILKRREWMMYGYYTDYLTFGHYLDQLYHEGNFLSVRTGYGTVADALIDNNRDILCTDITENDVDTVSPKVRERFRVVDELSPSIRLGKFTTVLALDVIDYTDDKQFALFSNFLARHAGENLLILVEQFNHLYDDWVYVFEKQGFYFDDERLDNILKMLQTRVKIIELSNILTFRRKEIVHAWSSEDA